MACAEVGEAIKWAKAGNPVTAFLTVHIGQLGSPGSPVSTDICIYAYGKVEYVARPRARLVGDLQFFSNGVTMVPDMAKKPGMTIGVEIWGDDQFSFQYRFNGQPTAGMPTKVTGACVKDVLLTAVHVTDIVTLGVRRDRPATPAPPAKNAAPAKKAAPARKSPAPPAKKTATPVKAKKAAKKSG